MPTEATLTKSLVALIKRRGGWAKKTHGGPASAGWLDVTAVYRGVPIFIEVKLPGREGTLTKLQKQTMHELRQAGAIARMYTRRSQVGELLDRIDYLKDKKGK